MAEIGKNHDAAAAWAGLMARIRNAMARLQAHPSHTVVLVPYAQLIQVARHAWGATVDTAPQNAAFVPRFESTMNWARALGGFTPRGDDLRLDAAHDALTARSLLRRAGLAEHHAMLAPRLMEAAWGLAGVAAAIEPPQRSRWGAQLANTVLAGLDEPVLAFEAAVGRIALAWASTSSYATDVLFRANPELLVVIDGFQSEPLLEALTLRMGGRCERLALSGTEPAAPGTVNLHAAADFEDEAERAAACVLQHLAADRGPVALVALDRQLTRRIRAMLGEQGVAIRDETGWKLSTTRAAASLMSLLRASRWDASTDEVLDWLKNAPAFGGAESASGGQATLSRLEQELRKIGLRDWPSEPEKQRALSEPSLELIAAANTLRDAMQQGRTISQWLSDLQLALRQCGQWAVLSADTAGRSVLVALGLKPNVDAAPDHVAPDVFAGYAERLSAAEFSAWAAQTLEAANFSPPHPEAEQVVILPLAQLLGRPLNAVVMAGCDDTNLQVSPELPGAWTPSQRLALGLPSRAEVAAALRKAWQHALQTPQLDILWRSSEGGERCMPGGFVQELLQVSGAQAAQSPGMAPDPRATRDLAPKPSAMPRPTGQALPVQRLSASAYEDLRRCPYRFFALRQLKLAEADELDAGLDKRDFGNWLHRVLFNFHQALNAAGQTSKAAQEALINRAAEQATQDLGLSGAEFLPFAAAWPKVRAGYLDWLAGQLAGGQVFTEGEAWKEIGLGPVTLVGKLDRIDRGRDGKPMVMDYKTESRTLTAERIKRGNEDTQLAFYAALLDVDDLGAAYVNVGEKEGTKKYDQPDIVNIRSALAEGILADMQGIASGSQLPAMGEGFACDFCAARGLCRKDFWSDVAPTLVASRTALPPEGAVPARDGPSPGTS